MKTFLRGRVSRFSLAAQVNIPQRSAAELTRSSSLPDPPDAWADNRRIPDSGTLACHQDPLNQGMLDLFLGADGDKLLFDAFAETDSLHAIAGNQLFMDHPNRREYAHTAGAKCLEQGTVLELAYHAWLHALALEPLIDKQAHRSVGGGQQNRNLGKRLRETTSRSCGE